MTIESKIRIDAVVPDPNVEGGFIINGSAALPDEHGLEVGRTYAMSLGDEVSDAIPVPEPGTEADPAPLPGQEPVEGA